MEKQKNATFYYQHDFEKEDQELRVEYNTSLEDDKEDKRYTTSYIIPADYTVLENIFLKQLVHENELTVDYTQSLTEDSKLEAGYDGFYDKVNLIFTVNILMHQKIIL